MGKTYLLDTNVLSGLLSKDPIYTRGVQAYADGNWAISSITEFELFLYKEKFGLPSNLFQDFLSAFIVYPLDTVVYEVAARLFTKRQQSKPHMADLLIAASSIVHQVPLITADKDMQKLFC
ncbi:type II toxin-antitoxin system VapC family toxin [Candidatus Peregrinibacteria bacterium]|nr:MAG: type II toxin-antitoxin system VapC family toxin [Candidatus Peregrinibacteria bacterium]